MAKPSLIEKNAEPLSGSWLVATAGKSGMRSVCIASRSILFAHPSRTALDDGCALILRMILSEKSATLRDHALTTV